MVAEVTTDANRATVERIKGLIEQGDLDSLSKGMYELQADDFVEEWPQSGERIRGRDNSKAINDNYPQMTGSNPKMKLRRITGEGSVWVAEGTIDYGDGTPISYVGITELRDGKIARVTEYFASPFEAPAWRSKWVEKID